MDTRKLVVGQYVDMFSGCYGGTGEVVEVTSDGVVVGGVEAHAINPYGNPNVQIDPRLGEVLHFDSAGKQCDSEGKPIIMDSWFCPGASEGGPWELIDDEQTIRNFEEWIARRELAERRKKAGS